MNIIFDSKNSKHKFYAIIIMSADKLNYIESKSINSIFNKWQLILLSDGSLTQNLYSLTGSYINIQISGKNNNLLINFKQTRLIWLIDKKKTKLVFAESLMNSWPNDINKQVQQKQQPIGEILSQNHKDIHKEIEAVYYGYSTYFNSHEPILARKCSLYYKEQYLMTIHEFFSPKLIYLF